MEYGFLGCGNMGGAIAKALAKTTKDILLTSRSDTAEKLAAQLGCSYSESNEELIRTCDVVFLAVKPQMAAEVLAPLVPVLQEHKPLLVSMAAGLTLQRIEEMCGGALPILRTMPNTPVAIGQGMTTYCHNALVEKGQMDKLLADLCHAGRFDPVAEAEMDAATAAAGCTPAYAYMFIDAIAQGATACGLPREKALQYAAAAVSGAAQLLMESGQDPTALRDAVCSPGGSTIAGVRALEEKDFQDTVKNAICAAYQRNVELGKQK